MSRGFCVKQRNALLPFLNQNAIVGTMKQLILTFSVLFCTSLTLNSSNAFAKTEVNDDGSQKAEQEASKYFRPSRSPASDELAKPEKPGKQTTAKTSQRDISAEDHYMTVHMGTFFNSTSYRWGDRPQVDNAGRLNLGFTYKTDQFTSIIDRLIRADLMGYELPEGKPVQLSALLMLMLPDSTSKFPLYFGVGIGPGFFFQQIPNESFLAINYQLVAGVRFFNVLDSVGFFAETGMKNHFLLLSDGQTNGFFASIGTIFTF